MPFVKKAIQYFKYLYKPNATIVGVPTITDEAVVSGFSSANYLKFPVTITSDSVTEGQICFITGSDVATRQGLFLCIPTDNSTSFAIYQGEIYLMNKSYAQSPSPINLGLAVVPNTKYYFKFTQNGTSIIPSLSTDGVIFTNGNTANRVQPFGSNIGYGLTDQYVNTPFLGSIDLKNTYIKKNGVMFWEGSITKISSGSSSDYDFTQEYNKLYNLARRKRTYYKYGTEPNVSVKGSPTINEGVVSGFSNSNYLTFLSFRPGTKIWEQHWEITTASNITTTQYFAGEGVVDYSKPAVGVSSGRWIVWISSTGTGWNIASGVTGGTVNANTTYYLKYGWNRTEYYLESSTDDKEFTRVITINNSNAIVDNSLDSVIGNSYFVGAWLGSVNLNNSYIKINSETWWHGTKAVESNESNYDYYTDNLVSYTPVVQDEFTYHKLYKETATGTYTIALDRDYEGDLLFVGNGGGGGSSQNDSYWRNTSGGSGACFQGRVRLPKGTYTLTIGTLGYGYNIGNTANMTGGVDSTDSYLTDENGNELIRVGCGVRGTVIGTGGAGGTLTLGTLEVLETTKAVNGNQGDAWGPVYGQGKQVFAVSAYDGTTSGYGAGTSSYYGGGNVYGVAGIFKLDIEYLGKGLRSY